MASDTFVLSAGTEDGIEVPMDNIADVYWPLTKVAFGAFDDATLVSASAGLPVSQQGTWNIGTVTTVTNITNAVAVTNAGLTELAAAIDTELQVDVVGALPAGDNNIGNVDIASIAAGDNNIGNVDVVTLPAITGTGTFVVQVDGNALTALQLIDDIVYVDDADWTDDTSKHALVGGVYQATPHTVTDGDVTPFLTDVNGRLAVAVNGTVAVSNAGLTELAAAINASSQMDVNIAANGIGLATSAKQDTIIGHVDGIEGLLTTIDGDTGTIAGAVIGTEMQVDVVAALPAGTNAIGKLAANDGVDIGDVTLTAGTNAIGKLVPADKDITGHTAYMKKYYTSTGAATDGIIWSPAAGTRWHITSIYIQISAAATITLEDDKAGGDEAIWKGEFAANSGVFMTFDPLYPWASGEDAADLIITTTAGNVYVTAVGYEV